MNTTNTNTNNTKNEIAIKWSPFKDEDFILVSSNILLYSIYNYDRSTKTRNDTNLYLSESSFAELVASVNTYPSQKLVSWYPGFDAGFYTLALHETNTTHIKVLSLFNQNDNITNSATLDVENQRNSNFVEWNPIKCNFLGLGFEKLNDNSSVCIWDAFFSTKPYLKLDECETCYSFAWHPENPDLLFTSGNYDCVSLFDIRAGTKPVESVNTEFVHGFSIDPKNSYHAASYDNNKLVIWDLRKFRDLRKPVALIEESKPIKRFQFCPAKEDRLAVLTENSQCVNIYRLEERDENILKHNVQYTSKHPKHPVLSSFSWHSKDFNRMMVSAYGSFNMNLFYDFLVTDFCLLGFSETTNLNVLCNDWDFSVRDVTKAYDELKSDIGERMKQRALNAYGVGDFLKNINLLSSDGSENDVKYLWYWLDLSNRINERPVGNMEKYFGVRTILSELSKSYPDPAAQNFNVKAYIQKVCGWCDWTELVNRLEANGEFERAACVCVFNNGVDRAIQILKNSSKSSNLNENLALSLALSCMHRSNTTESNKILTRLSNPYLKALFSYLIDSENFDYQILNDSQIFLPDKICMAMSFLKLEQLTSYIMRDLTPEFIKQGNLYGILLTGLGPECIELFQSYLHRTGDVQTPAVAVIHSTVAKIQNSKLVNGWIESYRELLDSWMLWTQRAEYDIKRSKPVEPKISIRCGHCGDNLSSKKKSRGIELLGANIAMACQACHQPLLRCSVCSLYMTLDPPKSAFDGKKDKMFYWFVFCQKCTHGGHLGHLKNWFSTNPECPVMACNCQCNLVK